MYMRDVSNINTGKIPFDLVDEGAEDPTGCLATLPPLANSIVRQRLGLSCRRKSL